MTWNPACCNNAVLVTAISHSYHEGSLMAVCLLNGRDHNNCSPVTPACLQILSAGDYALNGIEVRTLRPSEIVKRIAFIVSTNIGVGQNLRK